MDIRYRQTWAEVSLGAISHNAALFRSKLKPACRMMAVVKANGYGHGAVQAAQAALSAGADCLGVAILEEALQLRAAGIGHPILVLGYTPPFAIKAAVEHDVMLTVFSEDIVEEAIACTGQLGRPLRIHLKLDTGMTRLGLTSGEEALALAKKAAASRFVSVEGIFTHFAAADHPDPTYTHEQYERFQAFIRLLEREGIDIPVKHCCNSAAAIRFPHMHLDMIRVGIALYGLQPSNGPAHPDFPLVQAMQLKTRIAAVKHVPKGQPVSYGGTFVPEEDSVTATLPIGYADGLSRQLSNKGWALVRNTRVPIVGRVCMDQTIVNASSVPSVQVGDVVTLFGGTHDGDRDRFISVDEVASCMNTIHYEVVCLIGERVPRFYLT